MYDLQKYVFDKLIDSFEGELKSAMVDYNYDKNKKEVIGKGFKLTYVNLDEVEVWEYKGVGWVYLGNVRTNFRK